MTVQDNPSAGSPVHDTPALGPSSLSVRIRSFTLLSLLALVIVPATTFAQNNDPARSPLTDIELAFGIDTAAEDKATNEMAVCRWESRWLDLANACSNAVQRWPREQYFETWLSALENLRDYNSMPAVCRLYMDRCPQQRPSLYYRWTYAMRRANRVGEAITQLQEWAEKNPKETAISGFLARELMTEKRYDEAIRVLKDSVEYARDSNSTYPIWAQVIDALEAKNDIPAAIETAERETARVAASKHYQQYLPQAAHRLADLLKKAGRVEEHFAALEKRLAEKPDDMATLSILAELATSARDDKRAVKYRNLLAERTMDLPSLLKLREALERAGSTNEEVAVIEKILAVKENNPIGYGLVERLALLYAATGDTVRACSMAERSLAANKTPENYAYASSIALRVGDRDLANKWIDAALKKKPQGYTIQSVAMQLIALARHREALDLALPEKKTPYPLDGYQRTQVMQALIKSGQTNMVLERLNQQADSSSTDVNSWRQLATIYQEVRDFTNAAACWKHAFDLTGNDYERQWWIRSLEQTDQLEPRFLAVVDAIKKDPRRGSYQTHSLLPMAQSFLARGDTNRVVAISAIVLEYAQWDVQHENFVRMFNSMEMPDRALKHVKAGLDSFERQGLIPEGNHMRRQAWPILLKYRMTNEIVEYLAGAARHAGQIIMDKNALTRLADTIGPERWGKLVADGETPEATLTQQVLAAYMLTGSNLLPRAHDVLMRVYANNPCTATFDILKDNYRHRRDNAAILALYTNHLERAPTSIRNEEFVAGMLNAFNANPAAGIPFARLVAGNFSSERGVALQAAQLLQTARCYDDAMTIYTNALRIISSTYVINRISSLYEAMGQPAKGAVVAFHARTLFGNPYETSECSRLLDSVATKSNVPQNLLAMAEDVRQGKPVNCLYADKVDWPALTAWAAERTGDYAKAIAFHKKTYEEAPSPATGRTLASLLFKAGLPDDAIAMQTRAVQDSTESDKHAARMELLRMLVADCRYAQAVPMIEEMLASAKTPEITKELGDIRSEIEIGRKQQQFVQDALDRADSAPKDAAAQRAAAQSLRLTGRHMKAAAYYRRALAMDDQTATRWDLAYVLSAARQHKDAVTEYQALLGRELSSQERDSAIKAIAESHDALGDTELTLSFLTARLGEIKTASVRNWANTRINALGGKKP